MKPYPSLDPLAQHSFVKTIANEPDHPGRIGFEAAYAVYAQEKRVEVGLTMIPRHELYAATPHEGHAALDAVLEDGHGVEVSIGAEGVSVHKVPADHPHLSPRPAHELVIDQSKTLGKSQDMGHER